MLTFLHQFKYDPFTQNSGFKDPVWNKPVKMPQKKPKPKVWSQNTNVFGRIIAFHF